MKTVAVTVALALLMLMTFSASVEGRVYGEKKKGTKGRYLELEDGVNLSEYRGALVIIEAAEITSDKDKPVDTEAVRVTSDDSLRQALKGTGIFGDMVDSAPLELPDDTPILRLTTDLTLQHGSQAMRFFVGAGAGKSKLHIRLDIVDARTGRRLGFFNGYGTGAGFWSMSGGGIQRMARDDFEENYKKLADYLTQAAR